MRSPRLLSHAKLDHGRMIFDGLAGLQQSTSGSRSGDVQTLL
jgi:hypothetical protein